MKKVILTLFVSLSCILIANAGRYLCVEDTLTQKTGNDGSEARYYIRDLGPVADTLPKRVICGLEVTPIRMPFKSGKIFWTLRASEFPKYFRKFESKYPGRIDYGLLSEEAKESIYDWKDRIWETIVPAGIKALEGIEIRIFVDKEGRVFTAEFRMWDDVFQKLTTLPQNTLKDLYRHLIKEQCKAVKDAEFQSLLGGGRSEYTLSMSVCGSFGEGTEYVVIDLRWGMYDIYGTFNLQKLSKEEQKRRLLESFERERNNRTGKE